MSDKQIEALELALEALVAAYQGKDKTGQVTDAITAIREALAEQPAQQEPVAQCTASDVWNCKYCRKNKTCDALNDPRNFASPPAQQEPVAYMGTDIEGNPNKFRLNPFDGSMPLYKKPQSVKVWDAEGYDALCQELEGWKARALKAEQLAQPSKPLTDDRIWELKNQFEKDAEMKIPEKPFRHAVRSIESLLGVKVDA